MKKKNMIGMIISTAKQVTANQTAGEQRRKRRRHTAAPKSKTPPIKASGDLIQFLAVQVGPDQIAIRSISSSVISSPVRS